MAIGKIAIAASSCLQNTIDAIKIGLFRLVAFLDLTFCRSGKF
ncbi:hypothetical protein [Chamaesiphon sp. OTE_75_metabat_556]|jgi:hypothetical protein|nr:hypothetical protein [Chamaesiphon sp. OTE_75_metabat_556]